MHNHLHVYDLAQSADRGIRVANVVVGSCKRLARWVVGHFDHCAIEARG